MTTINPYSLDVAFGSAFRRIEAAVVVGGSLFEDPQAYRQLRKAATRGVSVKLLFPSPRSKWLQAFTTNAGIDLGWYASRILEHARWAVDNIENAEVRWYDAPGPCWFVAVDGSVLYTKPITAEVQTFPMIDERPAVVAHFAEVFSQLWSAAYKNLRRVFPSSKPLVRLISAAEPLISSLASDPTTLNQLTPEAFELFIADRLSAMRLAVKRLGVSNTRDGGIDILAWPEQNAPFPFLLAVQVKHSRVGRPVGPGPVRELRGVLAHQPIDAGLIVTNTSFTPDAQWAAADGGRIIRLRGFSDLVRWIRSDFAKEAFDRDLPREILLAPGLKITIPQLARPISDD